MNDLEVSWMTNEANLEVSYKMNDCVAHACFY